MSGLGNILKKFLDRDDIEKGLDEVTRLAGEQHVDVALCGGVAMQFFGSDRMTKDLDFVASNILSGIRMTKPLSFGGAKGFTTSGVPVDMIVRQDDFRSLYEEALERSQPINLDQLSFDFETKIAVRLVLPEYLAAMKLAAGRVKDEEDLRCLIRIGLVHELLEKIVKKHLGAFALKELRSHTDEMEWRMKKASERE